MTIELVRQHPVLVLSLLLICGHDLAVAQPRTRWLAWKRARHLSYRVWMLIYGGGRAADVHTADAMSSFSNIGDFAELGARGSAILETIAQLEAGPILALAGGLLALVGLWTPDLLPSRGRPHHHYKVSIDHQD